ncbi:hypothetical protein AMECASPLE_038568 [Ameca splendens]|uniref:Uncharacterized protein n=1 Tax=Ameca splendens TaxID=208324 RepID=A0ABV0Y837_9TELE
MIPSWKKGSGVRSSSIPQAEQGFCTLWKSLESVVHCLNVLSMHPSIYLYFQTLFPIVRSYICPSHHSQVFQDLKPHSNICGEFIVKGMKTKVKNVFVFRLQERIRLLG